jgi:hypothetical protein
MCADGARFQRATLPTHATTAASHRSRRGASVRLRFIGEVLEVATAAVTRDAPTKKKPSCQSVTPKLPIHGTVVVAVRVSSCKRTLPGSMSPGLRVNQFTGRAIHSRSWRPQSRTALQCEGSGSLSLYKYRFAPIPIA